MRGDQNETSVAHAQDVLGYRTDVIALDAELLKLPSYLSQERRRHPGLVLPWSAYDGGHRTSLTTLVAANLPLRPVYAVGGQEENRFGRPFESIDAGPARRLFPTGSEPDAYTLLLADPSLYASLRYPGRAHPPSTWEGSLPTRRRPSPSPTRSTRTAAGRRSCSPSACTGSRSGSRRARRRPTKTSGACSLPTAAIQRDRLAPRGLPAARPGRPAGPGDPPPRRREGTAARSARPRAERPRSVPFGVVVGQEPVGVDAAEPGLGGEVGLAALEALIVAAALGGRHPLPFDLVLVRRPGAAAREPAPEA
jgi:hypothetical protein